MKPSFAYNPDTILEYVPDDQKLSTETSEVSMEAQK